MFNTLLLHLLMGVFIVYLLCVAHGKPITHTWDEWLQAHHHPILPTGIYKNAYK